MPKLSSRRLLDILTSRQFYDKHEQSLRRKRLDDVCQKPKNGQNSLRKFINGPAKATKRKSDLFYELCPLIYLFK